MKNKLLVIGFSLFLFSCENDMEKLRGHWHIYEYNENGYLDTNEYHTIDIINSDSVLFDKYNGYPFDFAGIVNTEEKTILLRGECNILDYKYKWKNDSLFLAQIQHKGRYFAEKCGMECCDKQKDFFSEIDLEIDLPIIKDTSTISARENFFRSLELPIIIGIPKRKMEGHREIPRLKLDDKYARADDIKAWQELVEQTVPLNYRDSMFFTLYANKTVDLEELFEILNELEKLQTESIYLALREENTKDKFKVWRKKVSLNDPNLKTIIQHHYIDFWEN